MWKYRQVGDWHELDDEWGEVIYMAKDGTIGNLLEIIANKHNRDVRNAKDAYNQGYQDGNAGRYYNDDLEEYP